MLAVLEALFDEEELPSADSVTVAETLRAAEEDDEVVTAADESVAFAADVTDATVTLPPLPGVVMKETVLLLEDGTVTTVVLVLVEVGTDVVDVDVAAAAEEEAELDSWSQMPAETCCVFSASSIEHASVTQPVILSVSSEALAH